MKLTRYLRPEQIRMELRSRAPEQPPEGWSRERLAWSLKEAVLDEMVELFEASGRVVNPSKLRTDLLNRERKATTGLGQGFAMPHVRTLQARDLILAFARSTPGIDFLAIDGAAVHLFVGVVAPPYDDRLYLRVYKRIAESFVRPEAAARLLQARDAHEVIRLLSDMREWDRL